MENFKTNIFWCLHDYCKSECEYCPIQLRGGPLHRETSEYVRVINLLIDSYKNAGRSISWYLDGGEPLDMDDIVTILKLCRTNGDFLLLNTNGGKLWMDWWAIEPYVDSVNLTFHYWQNPALVKYIIDTFKEKGKTIKVTAPIRPGNNFESDITRAVDMENTCNFYITKTVLYKEADRNAGMFPYTTNELNKISFWNRPLNNRVITPPPPPRPIATPDSTAPVLKPPPVLSDLAKEKIKFETTTWNDRYKESHNNPFKFTGQLCNAGVESLHISHGGWVSGSYCGNQSMGNIWQSGWYPSIFPQKCTMLSCAVEFDRTITKFPVTVE
jgi:organic radical activating enzyme